MKNAIALLFFLLFSLGLADPSDSDLPVVNTHSSGESSTCEHRADR